MNAERSPASRPCERRIATAACYQLRSHERLSVTVDSPEKQRVGIVAQCHGAVGQDWPPAEVAAAVVFELTPSGCDLSTATRSRKRD